MVGRTISHYKVLAEVGRGGMGVVYRAEDLRLGRQVALKFLPAELGADRDALDRFQREARTASALSHPHICTIYDIDAHEGQPFIVMELLEGRTLREMLAGRRLELPAVIDLAMQMADGVAAAHAKGIIHRDIKPANLFVTTAGQVKILDFGLAKLAADERAPAAADRSPSQATVLSPDALITSPGQTLGTVAYMSPEQVRGEELDPRTDIFSCGVVIYEMATGRLPFPGATTGVVFDGILNRRPAPVSAVNSAAPVDLDRLLDKALEKDRDLRYQSARDLRADLARLKRDSGSAAVASASVSVTSVTPVRPRRRRALIAASAVAGIAVVGVLGYLAWAPRAPTPAPAVPAEARTLTRVTFDDGLQEQPTWSPDGRFIAYASNQSGNFDIWVQPLGGGRAVQVTTDPATDWEPAWSPDGNSIAFRSEREGGGIFVVPALGGRERKLAAVGYEPSWSADGSKIFAVVQAPIENASRVIPQVYEIPLNGGSAARILEDQLSAFADVGPPAWHPDGKRLSFFAIRKKDGTGGLWTLPLSGGEPTKSTIAADVLGRLQAARLSRPIAFKWGPKGNALYYQGYSKGTENLWKIGVDPDTLQWVSGPDRLTTSSGVDSDIALSPDGGRLAFVTRIEASRLWSWPFDAKTGRVTGNEQAMTAASTSVSNFDLSVDGTRLAFLASRPGKQSEELWTRTLADGRDTLIGEAPGGYFSPRLSRDGTRVAYRRATQLRWIVIDGGEEQTLPEGTFDAWDWSPDGQSILLNCPPPEKTAALCLSSRGASHAADVRRLVSDPAYNLWQGRFSPDGRWVAFNAQNLANPSVSRIGVAPASGGSWTPMTDAALWADKPRWSPDGRTIYFISNRQGAFFNVWGIHVDPATGKPVGPEFRVTQSDNPSRIIAAGGGTEMGVSATRLVVPMRETSGSIWVLDHVDQ
jgi:Tol biopolymer transport system component